MNHKFLKNLIAGTAFFSASSIAQPIGLELSQACAADGCFQGDAPGFPITIARSGSYFLTSNLTVDQPGDAGIVITASDVYLTLNNFVIDGLVQCSGNPVTCPPDAPPSNGVAGTAQTKNITVEGGTVRGFGQWGVATDTNWRISRIRAIFNNRLGIYVRRGSIVEDSLFEFNAGAGAQVGELGTLINSQSSSNSGPGITTFDTDPGNGGRGGATLESVAVFNNLGPGIQDHGRASIVNSVVFNNQSYGVLSQNGGTRIASSRIFENNLEGVAANNGGFFVAGGLPVTIRDSFIEANNGGGTQVSGGRIQILEGTTCGFNVSCQ